MSADAPPPEDDLVGFNNMLDTNLHIIIISLSEAAIVSRCDTFQKVKSKILRVYVHNCSALSQMMGTKSTILCLYM